jgi:4'-phosphopantetheinyl transferase
LFAGSCGSTVPPALVPGDVHVWQFRKRALTGELDELHCLLAADEHKRVRRFHQAYGREMFIIARGLLRKLLGSYLGLRPGDLSLGDSVNGKPELLQHGQGEVHFNVAHSGDVIVIAFGCHRRVGVDVEQVQLDHSLRAVAERFFSDAERIALRALPQPEYLQAFYRCWTRKEAYLKATGAGLTVPLDTFDVSVRDDHSYDLVQNESVEGGMEYWRLQNLNMDSGYAAALATECWPGDAADRCGYSL